MLHDLFSCLINTRRYDNKIAGGVLINKYKSIANHQQIFLEIPE